MKHHIDIIDGVGIRDIFIEMNKSIVYDEDIRLVTNKYKTNQKEMNEVYRCIRSLVVDDNLIKKAQIHIKKLCVCGKN